MKHYGFKYRDMFPSIRGGTEKRTCEITIILSESGGSDELNIIDGVKQMLQLSDPEMEPTTTLEMFLHRLRAHDWFYEKSDDDRRYHNGAREMRELLELARARNWRSVFDEFHKKNLGRPYFLSERPVQELNATGEPSEADIVGMMSTYGGGFVQALAEAYRRADVSNRTRLQLAFPHYWREYSEMWKLAQESKEKGGEGE
jgi:hypothetical protein